MYNLMTGTEFVLGLIVAGGMYYAIGWMIRRLE